jgi:dephospho-CoA kinase
MSFILGITGGIGSGKSAATQWFESQGIVVVDADIVAREVVELGQPALKEIQLSFGDWVLLEDGNLNRRALREHIFQFPEARETLEKITHPAIRQSIIQQLQQAESPYVILVSPLLFETNQHELVHHTLLIDAMNKHNYNVQVKEMDKMKNKSEKLSRYKCLALKSNYSQMILL